MDGKTMEDCVEAFNAKVKTKTFEQFSLMMIDWKSASTQQKQLLYNILFLDSKSVDYWKDYIDIVLRLFPKQTLQLQRLISKAIEVVEMMQDNAKYLAIHIAMGNCKKAKEDAKRYFELSIYRKNIGRKFSNLYLAWAEVAKDMGMIDEAVRILQMGFDAGAEPRLSLHNALKSFHASFPDKFSEAPEAAVVSAPASTNFTSVVHKSSRLTPRGLGKCMRVAPSEEVATDGFDDPTPLEAPSRPQVEDAPCDISLMNNASKQPSKKELQGKYMSESLRNFRPALPSKSALESKPAMVLSDTLSSSSNDLEDCTEKMAEEDIQRMASVSSNPQLMMTLAPKSSSTTTESLKSAAVLKPIAIEPTKKEITPKTSKKRVSFGGNDMAPEALAPVEIKRPKTEQQVQIWSDNSNNPEPSSQVVTTNIFNEPDRRLSINGKSFMSLSLLGKGGSSVVQRVISCQDGAIYALKRIQISSNDQEDADAVFHSYTNEIDLLKRLQGSSPYIIELVDHVINTAERSIAMLLEPGDIDLAKLLNQRLKAATAAGSTAAYLDPIFARMVWKEMLLAVHHIHTHRIIHGDLKPANFVFVKGHLKLIDFGIAKRISNDTTNIYRDSQIGTVNYMAPEAISPDSVIPMDPSKVKTGKKSRSHQYSMKLGRASDIWSLGCILYQMIYSRPPFSALSTIQKLTAIPNPKYAISYPAQADVEAVASIQLCLQRDPRARASIVGDNGLLQQPYLTVVGASASALSASASSTFTAAEQQQQTIERVVELLKQQAMSTFVPKSSSNNAAMATVSQRIQTWFDGLNTQQLADQVRSDPSVAANDEEDEDDADSCMTTETMQSPQSASAAASLGTSSSAADSAVHSDSDTEAEEDGDKADADEDDDCDTMQSTVKMEVEDGLGMGPAPVVAAAVSCGAPLGSGKVIFGKAGAKNKIILPVDEKENRCVTAANVPAPAVDQSISVVKKRPLQAQSQQPIVSHANELVDALAKRRKVVSVDSEENRVVSRSTVSVPQSVSTLASSSSAKKAARPAKASSVMTTTLKDQILAQASNLRDTKSEAAQRVTAKWQRPAEEGVEDDLKSLLARKMEDMRKFMDIDHDNVTATESLDLSGWIE